MSLLAMAQRRLSSSQASTSCAATHTAQLLCSQLYSSRATAHRHQRMQPPQAAPRTAQPGGGGSSSSGSSGGSSGGRPKPASLRIPTDDDVQHLELSLPRADFSRIKKSVFVSSSVNLKGCPPEHFAEFAVIGRSNVGKSSFINMLTQNDKLAKVSKAPGMTKTINHFLINDSWYLVDLPGYGYAKSAKSTRMQWLDFTKSYFLDRGSLVSVLLLVDSSVPPMAVDLECASWLGEAQVPFAIAFTKVDAAKRGGEPSPAANMAAFKRDLLAQGWEALPACFATSAKDGRGRTEVLAYLASLRGLHEEEEAGL